MFRTPTHVAHQGGGGHCEGHAGVDKDESHHPHMAAVRQRLADKKSDWRMCCLAAVYQIPVLLRL